VLDLELLEGRESPTNLLAGAGTIAAAAYASRIAILSSRHPIAEGGGGGSSAIHGVNGIRHVTAAADAHTRHGDSTK
jgi:hypothetical protein